MKKYTCIKKCQNGEEQAKLELINKFIPLIKKYNRKIVYEDIETDLIIAVLETVNRVNLSKFKEDAEGALVNYFVVTIKNKYIDIIKKSNNRDDHVITLSDEILEAIKTEKIIDSIDGDLYINWLLHIYLNFKMK